MARALQLARVGLQAEGRAAAQELLAMGVSQADVQQGLPELLLAVGLYNQAVTSGKISGGAQEADPAVLARAADRAVADPATAPASLSGIREGAAMVRAALDALSAGNEGAVMAALSEVPRNSPFAEWKFFVRGLAAYYQHDDEAMRANWDRLAPDRFAARLAAPLRCLADPALAIGDRDEFRQAVRILEPDIFGGPVVWYLESLQKSLKEDRWREAVVGVRRWKKEFQLKLPGLAQRLDRLFYDLAIRKANPDWLREMITTLEPPRWDPRWNRAWAMILESDDGDIETIEYRWLAYMEDLASIPDVKLGEQSRAQAMIWERLGRHWTHQTADYCDCEECRRDREANPSPLDPAHALRARAIECFNKAISLVPGLSTAYHFLAKNYVAWKQEDAAAEVHRRLLANVPDDFEAILFLFHYHRKRGEGLAVRDYALQARRLKPVSEETLKMVVTGHFLAAQVLALQGKCEKARAELVAVEAAGLGHNHSAYDLTVRRAMVEFKAGQPRAGRQWVDQALTENDDPADVYLALAIESVRYELPFELEGLPLQFWNRWLSSLKKRRSRAAGDMSRRFWALMQEDQQLSGKYAFLNDYLERVIKYASGCSRIRWQAPDLLNVCRFFERVIEDRQFREVRKPFVKFLDIGRKKFPQEPDFHVMRGQVEMRKGTNCCDRRLARNCFEMAIKTAKSSAHPRTEEIQQLASKRLKQLGPASVEKPQARSSQTANNYSAGDFAAASNFFGMPDFFQSRGSREEVIEMIRRMTESMDLTPEEMVEKILEKVLPNASAAKKRRK